MNFGWKIHVTGGNPQEGGGGNPQGGGGSVAAMMSSWFITLFLVFFTAALSVWGYGIHRVSMCWHPILDVCPESVLYKHKFYLFCSHVHNHLYCVIQSRHNVIQKSSLRISDVWYNTITIVISIDLPINYYLLDELRDVCGISKLQCVVHWIVFDQ